MFLKKNNGFTLVEIMVVIAIIGLLAVVLIPKIGSSKNSAKDAGVLANVRTIQAELEQMNLSTNQYTTQEQLDELYKQIQIRVSKLNLVNPYSGTTVVLANNPADYVVTYNTPGITDLRTKQDYDADFLNAGFWDRYVPGGIVLISYLEGGKRVIGIYGTGSNGPITPMDKVPRVSQ